jgi:hypothetical protein
VRFIERPPIRVANLGYMYELGAGIARDKAAAARLYRKAADLGNADAMTNLGGPVPSRRGLCAEPVRSRTCFPQSRRSGQRPRDE